MLKYALSVAVFITKQNEVKEMEDVVAAYFMVLSRSHRKN
jgi:hypothetical protein